MGQKATKATSLFQLGRDAGFADLVDTALLNERDYRQGVAVGRRQFHEFITSTVDHGPGYVIRSPATSVPSSKERRGQDPEASAFVVADIRAACRNSQPGVASLFQDMVRRNEVAGIVGGCVSLW